MRRWLSAKTRSIMARPPMPTWAPTSAAVDRVEAVALQRMVEAVDQVGRGVDQRAVEVEDDDRRAHAVS